MMRVPIPLTLILAALACTSTPEIVTSPPPVGRIWHARYAHPRGSITALAFSPDGETILSGGEDGSLCAWSASRQRYLWSTGRHTEAIVDVGFSPDGRTLASVDTGGTLILWDRSGREIREMSGWGPIAFSPDGSSIASGTQVLDVATGRLMHRTPPFEPPPKMPGVFSPDGTIFIALTPWGAVRRMHPTGKALSVEAYGTGEADCLAISPDGKILALGGAGIDLHDMADGSLLRRMENPEGRIRSVRFSPGGQELITWGGNSPGEDPGLTIWDIHDGDIIHALGGEEDPVTAAAYSPDGESIATGGTHGRIRIWDRAYLDFDQERSRVMPEEVHAPTLAFTPDGSRLATSPVYGTARIWEIPSGEMVTHCRPPEVESDDPWPFRPSPIRFSHDGRHLVSGPLPGRVDKDREESAIIWDAITGDPVPPSMGPETDTISVAAPPDGPLLSLEHGLSTEDRDRVAVVNIETGEPILGPEPTIIRCAGLSADGSILAVARWDEGIRVWDLATGKRLDPVAAECDWFAIAPDGKSLVIEPVGRGPVWLVHLPGGERRFEVHRSGWSPAYSPDGSTLIDPEGWTTLAVRDVATGRRIRTLGSHEFPVQDVAISPDERSVVTWCQQIEHQEIPSTRTVYLWDVPAAREILVTRGSRTWHPAWDFSPCGRYLALADPDGDICVREILTGAVVHRFPTEQEGIRQVLFSPDGSLLAASGSDASVAVFNLEGPPDPGPQDPWAALAGKDPVPTRLTVDFLEDRLLEDLVSDADTIRAWIDDLDHEDTARREAAFESIRCAGFRADFLLREALAGTTTPDRRLAIIDLLDPLDPPFRQFPCEPLRRLRAIHVLGTIPGEDARDVLREIAETSPYLRERQAAAELLVDKRYRAR